MTLRVIPRLDIKGPNLVKGIHLEGLRVLGKPEDFARHYYTAGADELIYMDTVASLYGRNSLLDLVARTSKNIFIPLTVGGGLRTVSDIQAALRAGADKVAINTAAIARPALIREAASRFGSSTIVISIEAMRSPSGRHEAFTDNGREATRRDVVEWAKEAAELGAGEILLTSIDQEGTGLGYDTELTRLVSSAVRIPVIACGGAGRAEDVVSVVRDGLADAVSLASVLHYEATQHGLGAPSDAEGNTDYLTSGANFTLVDPASVATLKQTLAAHGIPVRMPKRQVIADA